MKNLLYPFLCLLLSSIFCLSASLQAQTYNPFPGVYTFNYVFNNPGDTFLCSVKVDSVYASGPDSVYRFNQTMRLNSTLDWLGNCNGVTDQVYDHDYNVSSRFPNQPSSFGNFMYARPGGRYDFIDTLHQDTFRLETQLALGTSWTVNTPRGLTATFDSISNVTFFGVSDSVMHFSLCNGKSIRLSQSYGFLEAIPWVPIHHSGVPASAYPPVYELRGIDEIGLGTPRLSTEDIFDFAQGDRFQYYYLFKTGSIRTAEITEYDVQNWGVLPTGMGGEWMVEQSHNSYYYSSNDTTYSPPALDTALIEFSRYDHYFNTLESSILSFDSIPSGWVNVLESSHLVDGKVQFDFRRFYCYSQRCDVNEYGIADNIKFREGLGLIYKGASDLYGPDVETEKTELICAETSAGVLGTCQTLYPGFNSVAEPDIPIWQSEGEVLNFLVPDGTLTVVLYGMDGGRFLEEEMESSGLISIPLAGMNSGMYVMELRGDGIGVVRKRFFWGG